MSKRATFLTTTFLIGLSAAGYAMYHLYRNWKLADNAVRATATVMYLDTRIGNIHGEIPKYHRVNNDDDTCYETVIYETKEGERIVWQSSISTDMPAWIRGQDVSEDRTASILYDPEDPRYWEFDTTMAMFVNWFALLIGGMALMSLSFGPYDAVMRRLRETDEERESAVAAVREELSGPPRSGDAKETPRACEDDTERHVEFDRETPAYHPEFARFATEIETSPDNGAFVTETEESPRASDSTPTHEAMAEQGDDCDDGFEYAEDPFATMR